MFAHASWLFEHLPWSSLDIMILWVEPGPITFMLSVQFSSVAQLCPTLCYPMDAKHARLPCPSPPPRACSNSCPLSRWCHPTISSSVVPFSSHLQSFPASGSFPMSQFFASGGQSTGVSASASVLPMNFMLYTSCIVYSLNWHSLLHCILT